MEVDHTFPFFISFYKHFVLFINTMSRGRRIICWDLDETIGKFRDPQKMSLTKGILPVLDKLRTLGFRQVITTAASSGHTDFVLQSFNIGHYFEAIFSLEHMYGNSSAESGLNKHYLPVAVHFGISPAEAAHDMLSIGNHSRDAPADLDFPFIFRPYGSSYDAAAFIPIILKLITESDSWGQAHWQLHSSGPNFVKVEYFEGSIHNVEGVSIATGFAYWNPKKTKPYDRTIAVLESPPTNDNNSEMVA